LKGGEGLVNILLWALLGLVAGWIASVIMKTNDRQGWLMDVILGVLGGIVGGLVMNMIGYTGVTGFNIYSLIVSVIGAVVLIALGRAVATR
jgi:uncharacterized membrane protein YeaQ/YmgE (transglycosylase-associated protein family)